MQWRGVPKNQLRISEAGRNVLLGAPVSGDASVFPIGNLYQLAFSRSVTEISVP